MRLPEKEYYSLKEVAKLWDRTIFNYCTVDDLLHYAEIGKLEICVYVDPGIYKICEFLEELEEDITIKHPDKEKIVFSDGVEVLVDPGCPCVPWWTPKQWRNMQKYGHLQEDITIKHPDKEGMVFSVGRVCDISELIITHEEKLRFEAAYDMASNTKATIHSKPTHRININELHEVDEFVRSLTIYPENNDTINIQIPGKKAKLFTGHDLDFQKTSKTAVEWGFLQEIIREGRYCIRFSKTKDGEANRSCRRTVNKKMIKFLNKEFDAQIPPDYKLFEISREHEKGTWKPKFRIQPAGKFSDRTKEQIVKEIEVEFTKENRDEDRLQELCLAAVEKGVSEDEIGAIICEKHENIEQYEHKKEGGHIINIP